MATFLRLARQNRQLFSNFRRIKANISPACQITTSKKKDEVLTPTANEPLIPQKTEELQRLEEHFGDTDPAKLKNWISYGFNEVDKDEDDFMHHFLMLIYITMVLCGIAFRIYHFPDAKLREWSWREAHLRIEQAEREGRPLLDPNYIPVEQMELPSDEDLGDTDIIL